MNKCKQRQYTYFCWRYHIVWLYVKRFDTTFDYSNRCGWILNTPKPFFTLDKASTKIGKVCCDKPTFHFQNICIWLLLQMEAHWKRSDPSYRALMHWVIVTLFHRNKLGSITVDEFRKLDHPSRHYVRRSLANPVLSWRPSWLLLFWQNLIFLSRHRLFFGAAT